jgi:pSer/pThr/pTyr-binding forkhead associated (FHA) protein
MPESEKIVVEIMNGPEDGRTISCQEFPITIGRATDNVVHLPYDHLISRYHARVLRSEGQILLHDLNSTNGTYIGKRRIYDETPVEAYRIFRVGSTHLMLKRGSAKQSLKE